MAIKKSDLMRERIRRERLKREPTMQDDTVGGTLPSLSSFGEPVEPYKPEPQSVGDDPVLTRLLAESSVPDTVTESTGVSTKPVSLPRIDTMSQAAPRQTEIVQPTLGDDTDPDIINREGLRDFGGIGDTNPNFPASTTNVIGQTEYKKTPIDEANEFLGALSAGTLHEVTGLDVSEMMAAASGPGTTVEDIEQNLGFTVGQIAGFVGSYAGATRALRGLGPAFKMLSPEAQRIARATIIGGTLESAKQGMRGLFGQSVDPEKIGQTALLFGTSEALLMGIGWYRRTIWSPKSNTPVAEPIKPKLDPPPNKIKTGQNKVRGDSRLKVSNDRTFVNKPKVRITQAEIDARNAGFSEPLGKKAVQTVESWLKQTYHGFVKRGFYQSRNLLKSAPGQTLVELGDAMISKAGVREGKKTELMRKAGVFGLNRNERRILADILEHTDRNGVVDYGAFESGLITPKLDAAARAVRTILNDMRSEGLSHGLKIGGLDNYFPRVMRQDIAEKIYFDIQSKLRVLGETASRSSLGEGMTLSDRALSRVAKKKIEQEVFGRATERAIKSLTDKGMSRYDAIAMLERGSGDAVYMPFGNLEKARKLDLPLDFYERDVKRVMDRYISGWARRTSEAEQFGVFGEKGRHLVEKIRKIDPVEAKDAQEVLQSLMRVTEVTNQIQNGALRRGAQAYINFRVGTAIGLGFATIPNTTQTLISTYAKHGGMRTLRGLGDLFMAEGRQAVRESGATWWDAHKQLFGGEATGIGRTFSRVTTELSLFNSINTFNKALAAATSRRAIPEYWKAARGSGQVARVARRRLSQMGIDYKQELTEDAILSGMNKFANDSQLAANILNEPLWFNNPKLRTLNLFKRFGYRQAMFVKDQIIKEIYQDRNPLPFLRLVSAGTVGGYYADKARQHLKWFLSGEEPIEPDRDWFEGAINALAASGAAGVMSDLMDMPFNENWPEEFYGKLLFAINPIIVDDVLTMVEPTTGILPTYIKSEDRKKMQVATEKFVKAYGGSVTRYLLGYRLETSQRRRRRRQSARRRASGR